MKIVLDSFKRDNFLSEKESVQRINLIFLCQKFLCSPVYDYENSYQSNKKVFNTAHMI